MPEVVRLTKVGGVDGLEVARIPASHPGPGEIAVRQTAIGVNFIDVYHRLGLYPLPLPAVLGVEGVGVVIEVGPGVTSPTVGARVAYAGAPVGAYASERLIPAWRAIALPEGIGDALAAAGLLRGITAHMLLARTYPVGPGTTILVQAAAGGLVSILARWGKRLGAEVIGTVGSEAKADQARGHGCDHVLVGRDIDLGREVLALTGTGVDVAYDGVGGTTLLRTLATVRPFGTVASVGQAAGPIPPLAVEELGPRRSLVLARPSVMAYVADGATYEAAAAAVLAAFQDGIRPVIGRTYPLAQAARAQTELESGETAGSPILLV